MNHLPCDNCTMKDEAERNWCPACIECVREMQERLDKMQRNIAEGKAILDGIEQEN